ncbi:6345_t:CDS:2 [Diversispora eburnea]|uniref:6345_t:CDS:1 n=1 Tax=Diversispora eburnea TaxID=1213867 RepID=A0A9N9AWU6_9GLOM|nr:6345_t:CDS:2 [Diversispora eburnea]
MNYRIDLRREQVVKLIEEQDLTTLLQYDQLTHELSTFPYFSNFKEAHRIPSWTDRIIFKTRLSEIIENIRYESHINVIGFSDHLPITGIFLVEFNWQRERELLVQVSIPKLGKEVPLAKQTK